MTHRPRTLTRWHPLDMQVNQLVGPSTVTFQTEPPSTTLLVDLEPNMARQRNLVTLHRAAQVNGLLDSLFEPDIMLEGQPWYDRLPRIVAMDTEAAVDGEKMTFTWTDDTSWTDEKLQKTLLALSGDETADISEWTTCEIGESAVAEYVVVRILVRTEHETQARRLPTDFGVGAEYATWPDEAGDHRDTRLQPVHRHPQEPDRRGGLHEYSYDDKDDSPETQWLNFMDNAHTVAAKLLLNEDEAVAETIRHAARTHLRHLLPDDRAVQLRKKPAPPGEETAGVEVVIIRDDQAYGAKSRR